MEGKKMKFIFLAVIIAVVVGFFALRNLQLRQPDGEATLSWSANTETDLSGYKIYYGTMPRKGDCPKDGGYAKTVEAGNVTTYKLGKLDPGATYYFSITSLNNSGKESCFSPEMKKEIKLTVVGRLNRIAKWLHLQ
jgi:hypothetical protein